MDKLKFGIIGTGRIGRLHVENITRFIPEVEIVAVADVMIDLARDWADGWGIPNLFSDYRELLALEEIDAVIIATPTDTHAPIAVASAEAGKHIFCEKPIDMSLEKTYEVVQAVKKAGVTFQVGFNRRFDHNFRRVRQHVMDGTVGEPHIVRVTSRDPAPPPAEYVASSGGLFVDMMIHDFDMVRYLSGQEVKRVTAHGAVLVDPAIGEAGDIDTAVVTLELENGGIAVIDNSRQAVYGYDQRVEVFGSKGQAVAYNDHPNTVELYTDETVKKDKIPFFFLDRYTGAFVDQFTDFVLALKGEVDVPVDATDGLRALELALAAGESLRTGKTVDVKRADFAEGV